MNKPGGANFFGDNVGRRSAGRRLHALQLVATVLHGRAADARCACDPLEDFLPLYAGISASNAVYVRTDSPSTTFEEIIEGAKANRLSIGVNHLGAPPNLSAVQLANEFELEFKTIALKTVPVTMAGLAGGQVDVAVGQVGSIHVDGREKVRAIRTS